MTSRRDSTFEAQIESEHHHCAVRFRDLERAVEFYNQVVGLPIRNTAGDAARPRAVWFPGLQLVRSEEDRGGPGDLDHIGISVRNIEEICAHIEASGHKLDQPVQTTDLPERGQRFSNAWLTDPEGHRVELVQWEPLPE